MNADKDWITEKLLASEDKLMEVLLDERLDNSDGEAEQIQSRDLSDFPEPTPVDCDAEKQHFAELLSFLTDNPEDDCEFEALTLDDFADLTVPSAIPQNQE